MPGAGLHALLRALAVAACCAAAPAAQAQPPARVVSINLCTDQLAMLVAAPGQLHAVSHIARDPRVSAMTREAGDLAVNHGRAEEIYRMRPDLVLAGQHSARTTVAMLRRLGIPVAVIPAASSLDDVRDRLLQVGGALHREAAAQRLVAQFDARLARLQEDVARHPEAVLYYANGYTSGEQTLAGQILMAAGFSNAAAKNGYRAGMKLPLEVLAMTAPEIVITSRPYPGASRSEAILDHPVVQGFRAERAGTTMTDHDWVCGTPFVLRAIEGLARTRRGMTDGGP